MRNISSLETVYEDFSDKEVKFYYLYKALAHPERDGLVQPATLDERILHIAEAQRRYNTQWTWLADSPDNQVKKAFGDRPNSEFIIDPKGKIIVARDWSNENSLRQDLNKLVGIPKERTTIADLKEIKNLPSARKSKIASNVVPRVEPPVGSKTLITKPHPQKEQPLYLKLRVDAATSLLSTGDGEMRLGFWLDPIHNVHWNNLAAPLSFRFVGDHEEATFNPATGTAAKVAEEADYDPREFLITIEKADLKKNLQVEVQYFACHDTEDWCKAVTQTFEITFEADPHAGRASSQKGKRGGRGRQGGGGGREGREGGGGRGGRGGGGRERPSPAQFFTRFDSNGDGKLTLEEAPERMQTRFPIIDKNEDGALSKEELENHFNGSK